MKKIKVIDDWKYSNQNWMKVLDEIWKYAINRYGRGKTGYNDENHPLAKKLKIKAYDLMLIMAFLEEQKLIEYDSSEHNWIHLTEKGFDVALQNQSADRARRNNQATLFLSLVVAIAAIGSILIGINNLTEKWLISLLFVGAFIVGVYVIKRSY